MMERGKPVGCTKRCGDEDSWNGYNSYNNQDWYIKNPEVERISHSFLFDCNAETTQ